MMRTSSGRRLLRRTSRTTTGILAFGIVFEASGCARAPTPDPPQTESAVSVQVAAERTPPIGQIIIDPEDSRWLKRQGGRHVFICGPGDPEEFLYIGRRNADGTRDGDQVARIKKLIQHGGNCLYVQMVRTHGGDAKDDVTQNPFTNSDPTKPLDEDILNQWEEWFALADAHNILIYLFFYDDSARIWDTGDDVGPQEKSFFEAIVNRFQHHRNLIWIVAEESEERYSSARIRALGEVIRGADANGHLIGNHHLSGTTFKAWKPESALNHLAMQLSETGEAAHAGAIEAVQKAAGRYQVIYAESTATPRDADGMRRHAWAIAMGGLMPMILKMDIAETPVELLNQCRFLQTFMESTSFNLLDPHDELGGAGTKYVLADPGRSYLAYGDQPTTALGIKDLPVGDYSAAWLDCRTGRQAATARQVLEPGERAFEKPAAIGDECAVWIQRLGHQSRESPRRNSFARDERPSRPNRAPVVENRSIRVVTDVDTPIPLTHRDDDGPGPYSITIVKGPAHGRLTGDNNDRVYRAPAGFTGTDQFTWQVNDGRSDSPVATVTLSVGPQKDN